MEVCFGEESAKLFVSEAVPGEVYLLPPFKEGIYAICLDEEDEWGNYQFASFNGKIIHRAPLQKVKKVKSAKVVIEG